MVDVQFDEQTYEFAGRSRPESAPRGLAALLVKLGLTKDNRTANIALLGIFLACLLLIIFVFAFSGSGRQGSSPYTEPPIPAV